MTEEKWVAVVTNAVGSMQRYVAHDDRRRHIDGKPIYMLASSQDRAARFNSKPEAKAAALAILNQRKGKPFTGNLRGYGARLALPGREIPCPSFDWEGAGEDLYASLAVIIDQIDFTNQACSPTDRIGALLDSHLIEQAKERLSKWMNLRLKAKSQNGDGVGG